VRRWLRVALSTHGTSKPSSIRPIRLPKISIRSSTRGLDASTALEFVRALRVATDIARTSTIVSIYQASESLYDLFDNFCVIRPNGLLSSARPGQRLLL
jgi:hypothetical protein